MTEELVISNTELPVESKETFIQKYCSFSGRIGRETYYKKQFYLFLLLLLPAMLFLMLLAVVGLGSLAVFLGVSLGGFYLICNCSIATRRLHDLGRSGIALFFLVFGFIMAGAHVTYSFNSLMINHSRDMKEIEELLFQQALLAPLVQLIAVPFMLLISYIGLWPGQKKENEYGKPERVHNFNDISDWEQVKREFLSFSGRLSRKWFIGMLFLGISWNFRFSGIVVSPQMSLQMLFSSGWIYKLNQSMEIPLWVKSVAILNVVLGTVLFLALVLCFTSLVVRRIQDIGWPSFIGVGVVGFWTYIVLKDLPNILMSSPIGDITEESLRSEIQLLWITMGMIGLLMIIPSKQGENRYGLNPIEAGLLPGESAEDKVEET